MKLIPLALGLLTAFSGGLSLQTRQPPVVEVGVQVGAEFDGAPLPLEDVRLQTGAGNTISVSRLSMLLSEFELVHEDGTKVSLPGQVGWISAGDSRLRFRLADVPVGDYKGFSYKVGLSPSVNHADPAKVPPGHPLNPSVSNLHWGWSGGYVFLAIEGRYEQPGSRLGGYSFHLGNDDNLTKVTFNQSFNLGLGSEIRMKFDVRKLLYGISISDGKDTSHSAAGDPIAAKIKSNVLRAIELVSISQEAPTGSPEVVEVQRPVGTSPYVLEIPSHFPQPSLPPDNPLTEEGVALGRMLFNEKLLSRGNIQSCASCHSATSAFSDRGKAKSKGVDGQLGLRNSMPLFNLAWSPAFTWDGRRARVRDQVLAPIQDVREMHQTLPQAIAKLEKSTKYPALFAKAFGGPGITSERIGLAVEQYLLTIISADSKFDRALVQKAFFTNQEKRGLELFISEFNPARGIIGGDCFHCHGGNLFTDYQYKNNGLAEASNDYGREVVSGRREDRNKFKVPSLRNVSVTGPYMHDGRFKTLEEVVEHYSSGIHRSDTLDPNIAKHPQGGVRLSESDKRALVAFLRTLTDAQWQGLPGK